MSTRPDELLWHKRQKNSPTEEKRTGTCLQSPTSLSLRFLFCSSEASQIVKDEATKITDKTTDPAGFRRHCGSATVDVAVRQQRHIMRHLGQRLGAAIRASRTKVRPELRRAPTAVRHRAVGQNGEGRRRRRHGPWQHHHGPWRHCHGPWRHRHGPSSSVHERKAATEVQRDARMGRQTPATVVSGTNRRARLANKPKPITHQHTNRSLTRRAGGKKDTRLTSTLEFFITVIMNHSRTTLL